LAVGCVVSVAVAVAVAVVAVAVAVPVAVAVAAVIGVFFGTGMTLMSGCDFFSLDLGLIEASSNTSPSPS